MNIDWIALGPLIAIAAGSLAIMIMLLFTRRHLPAMLIAVLSMAAAVFLVVRQGPGAAPAFASATAGLIVMDRLALYFTALICGAGIAVALLAGGYLKRRGVVKEEFYMLLLLATLGCVTMAAARHFLSFFLGLELLSVSLYAMIAYTKSRLGVEAAIKYLVLAGTSSAFLLFGMALVYSELGTMDFAALAEAGRGSMGLFTLAGAAMIVVGIAFKLALAPMHMWTSDVYQGAPAPVTAFVATASKGAVLAVLLRLGAALQFHDSPALTWAFWVLAVASIFAGNLLALLQTNVKRVLAYSSIAHLGYMIVAFLAGGQSGPLAVMFYLVAYFVTMLGAFGVVTMLSASGRDAQDADDYRGLFHRRPLLAVVLTAMLLSLAGVPLTAGFIGKFLLLDAGVGSGLWTLSILLVLGSGIGLFYYLRIVLSLYAKPRQAADDVAISPRPDLAAMEPGVCQSVVLSVLSVLLVYFGVYPGPLISFLQTLLNAG